MRNVITTFAFLFGTFLFAQDDLFLPKSPFGEEVVRHTHFYLGYAEEYEQAIWVAYELTAVELIARVKRTDNFREDPNVSTGSATLADYKGSGYDRGHLAPAADMAFSSTSMSESFFLSNMSPQAPSFNRGIWKRLEEQVRGWAQSKGSIYVVTGGIISPADPEIGPNGVEVPSYYYKVLLDTKNYEAIGFVLANKSGSGPILSYAVSIDKVEQLTGLDFFSQLEDELEDRIESEFNLGSWPAVGFQPTKSYQAASSTSQQCMGIAKSTGVRCRNKTKNENGYCYQHQSQANANDSNQTQPVINDRRCQATTKAGSRCKRKAAAGSRYCWQHQ